MTDAAIYARESRVEFIKSLRTPEFSIPTIVFPLMFFGLFGIAMARAPDATLYMTATYGVFAALGPALFGFGAGVSFEREQGLLALKRISPMPYGAYPVAKLANALLMSGIVILALYAIAAAAGGVRMEPGRWAGLFAVHLLSVIPFGLLGLAVGYGLRSQGAMAVCNVLFFVLAALGGLWMPLHILPDWIGTMAMVLPSFHMGELALAAAGIDRPHAPGFHIGALAIWTVILAALSILIIRRSEA